MSSMNMGVGAVAPAEGSGEMSGDMEDQFRMMDFNGDSRVSIAEYNESTMMEMKKAGMEMDQSMKALLK